MRKEFPIVVLLVVSHTAIILSQETQIGVLDRDKVTAGEKFHLKVTLSEAPSYAAFGQQYLDYKPVNGLSPPKNPVEIYCSGNGTAGSRVIDMECSVPFDEDGGVYEAASQFRLGPPPGGSHTRFYKLQVPDVEIVPVEDKNVYPKSAVATVSLDQKQILQNGAEKVEYLLDQLAARADEHTAETKEFRAYLAGVAIAGREELQKVRTQYQESLIKGKTDPIFFEDFDRQFQVFIIEAKAPKIASDDLPRSGATHPQLIQFSNNESVTVRPAPQSESLGPYLSTLVQLLTNLRDAYRMIAGTGSDTFTISMKSTPPGATISYKRIGEEYQDYSSATDVEQATFPYAKWTFRFTLGHCQVVKYPNPYIEKSPNLYAQMQNCRTK